MPKPCDNKSVGVVVRDADGRILMIERKQYTFGFALPAGHQDGDDQETTAKKELQEEVGLTANVLERLLEISLPNPCLKRGGIYHDWTVFEATSWEGELKLSADETKSYVWVDKETLLRISKKLEDFVGALSLTLIKENLSKIVTATNLDPAWEQNPALEPPMYFIFKELKMIQ